MSKRGSTSQPTLCIGVGNDFRRDDAAGLIVARRLLEAELPQLTVVEASGEGAQLMQLWGEFDRVILVDATNSGAKAGTLHRIDAHLVSLPTRFFSYSTHAFSVAEAIEMARVLGKLPAYLTIYGIEGGDFTTGQGVSPEIAQTIEMVVHDICKVYMRIP